MDIRRIVPEIVQQILAVGREDVYSISLVVTGTEAYILVDVSGDNAATMIARRLWPDLPEKEGMYYLTVEGRIPVRGGDPDDDGVAVVVTIDPLHILLRDVDGDGSAYRRVYATPDARVPDHEALADGLDAIGRAFESGQNRVPEVAAALAAAHPAIVQWWGSQILEDALSGEGDAWPVIFERLAGQLRAPLP